ncbi:MAG: hypothetical protein ACKO2L_11975 [Planctomycetaceae bacterium]
MITRKYAIAQVVAEMEARRTWRTAGCPAGSARAMSMTLTERNSASGGRRVFQQTAGLAGTTGGCLGFIV